MCPLKIIHKGSSLTPALPSWQYRRLRRQYGHGQKYWVRRYLQQNPQEVKDPCFPNHFVDREDFKVASASEYIELFFNSLFFTQSRLLFRIMMERLETPAD